MNAIASRPTLWLALVALATILAYTPALSAPFIWDDAESIIENPSITRLWPPTVPLRPPSNTAMGGRPVVNFSFAINYAINRALGVDQRPDPDGPHKTVGYHAGNILIHLLCGLVLYGIVSRTLRSQRFDAIWASRADPIALVVTALWMLHPLQSEAVVYLTQRTELLVSLCYLGTLYAWIRGWDATAPRSAVSWRFGAVAICLVGMGSKEVMLTAPLIVVLYDRAFRLPSRAALRSGGRLPFYFLLAATSVLCLALVFAGARDESVGFELGVPWYRYLYSQAWAIAHYVRLVFWPSHLTLDYGVGVVGGPRPIPGLIFLSAFGIMTILAWRRPGRWGWFAFLGAWFFLTLAPSSSVVPIISEATAERRMYLALVAVIVLSIIGVDALRRVVLARAPEREAARRERAKLVGGLVRAWPLAASSIVLLLAITTTMRSREYSSAETIWRTSIERRPDNPRAYVNLANVIIRTSPARRSEAEALYRRAVGIDSSFAPALYNVAELALNERRVDDAKPLLDRALAVSPNDPLVLDRSARVMLSRGDAAGALRLLERAATRAPYNPEVLADLGAAYSSLGRLDDAARTLEKAVTVGPTETSTARSLGAVLIDLGRAKEAIPYLEHVVTREPDGRFGHALLSLAYAEAGRDEDAVSAAVRATNQSTDAFVLTLAGQAMLRADRASAAAEFLRQADRFTPNDPQILTTLGRAEAALGRREEAVRLMRRALAAAPNYPPARQELDRLTRATP
jgi:tetratricopeptide (TPR) repeat protein